MSTSHSILHYLRSVDLSKSFSQLLVSIFIFSQYFSNRFCPVEKTFPNWLFQYLSFLNIFFQQILSGGKEWGSEKKRTKKGPTEKKFRVFSPKT